MGISVAEYRKRLRTLMNMTLLNSFVDEIVFDDAKNLVKDKVDEFESGLKPSGVIIGRYRSEAYKRFKFEKNPKAGGNVDLILTGKFTGGLFLMKGTKRGYIFNSSDSKTAMLKDKYGGSIMGLNQEGFNLKQRNEYANELIKSMKYHAKIG
jgi:hypothetical protein